MSIDIVGDGNCFFRSFSLSIYCTQSRQYDLRAATARYFLDNFGSILELSNSSQADADAASANERANGIQKDGVLMGEDVILVQLTFLSEKFTFLFHPVWSRPGCIYSPVSRSVS